MSKRILALIMCLTIILSLWVGSYAETTDYSLNDYVYGTYSGSAVDGGIYFIHSTKNYTVEETHASYTTKDGERCVSIDEMLYSVDSYGFFRVNDSFYYNGNSNLYMVIDYFDENPLEFVVEYESLSNTHEQTKSVKMQGTGEWKQAVLELPNAKMANGIRYDSDFRIVVKHGNQNRFYFKRVALGKSLDALEDIIKEGAGGTDREVYNFSQSFCPGDAAKDITKVQGVDGFRYLRFDGSNYYELTKTATQWVGTDQGSADNGLYPKIYYSKSLGLVLSPSGLQDAAIEWTAPKSGDISLNISARTAKVTENSRGASVKVIQDGTTIKSYDVLGTDDVGISEDIDLTVSKGEKLYFRVSPAEWTEYDRFYVNPIITYKNESNTEDGNTGDTSLKTSKARIGFGSGISRNGLDIVQDFSRFIYTETHLIMTNEKGEIESELAFKLDDNFEYRDTAVNPIYVNLKFRDKDGVSFCIEYMDIHGNIVRTKKIKSSQTSVFKTIAFKLPDIDLNTSRPYDFKIISEQVNGAEVRAVELMQTVPQEYELTFEATKPETEDGLTYLKGGSGGYITNQTALLGKNYIQLDGITPKLALSVDSTYSAESENAGSKGKYAEVTYFDNGTSFHIEYNKKSGAVKTETVKGENSLKWKKAVFRLENIAYTKDGTQPDLYIAGEGGDKLLISKIALAENMFNDFVIGQSFGNADGYTGINLLNRDISTDNVEKSKAVRIKEDGERLYFDIDDSAFGEYDSSAVYNLVVKYFDYADLKFSVLYDAKGDNEGETWVIEGSGTNKWKTANFPLSKVEFRGGGENGSDFSVVKISGGSPVAVSEVTLRHGLGQMVDFASEICFGEVNDQDQQVTEDDLNHRMFAPTYNKYGNDRIIHGAKGQDNKVIIAYAPSYEPINICGVNTEIKGDDFYVEYLNLETNKWERVTTVKRAGAMATSPYMVTTFEPVYTNAIKYVCSDYVANGTLNKLQLFTTDDIEQIKWHDGDIEISGQEVYKDGETPKFNISVSSNDNNNKEYKIKVSVVDFYRRDVLKDFAVENISSKGDRSFSVSLDNKVITAGAYYLVVDLYNGNMLIDKKKYIFGRQGENYYSDESLNNKAPKKEETPMMGTWGQSIKALGVFSDVDIYNGLRESGYDTVTFEFYWRQLEPLPGVYEFEYIDRAIKNAMDAGLTISIRFMISDEMLPPWYPQEESMLNQYGDIPSPRFQDLAGGHYALDSWPSIWSPTWLTQGKAAVEKFISRYRYNPYVVGFAFSAQNLELDIPNATPMVHDYSVYAQNAFKEEYLKKWLNLDLDALNERWRTNYTSWDEVSLYVPDEELTTSNYTSLKYDTNPAWVDTIDFQGYSKLYYCKMLDEIVAELAPGKATDKWMKWPEIYDEDYEKMALEYGNAIIASCSNERTIAVEKSMFWGGVVDAWVYGEPGTTPARSTVDGNVGRTFFFTGTTGKARIGWQGLLNPKGEADAYLYGRDDRYSGVQQTKDLIRIGNEALPAEVVDHDVALTYTRTTITESGVDYETARSVALTKNPAETSDINSNYVKGMVLESMIHDDNFCGVEWLNGNYATDIYMSVDRLKQYKLILDSNSWYLDETAQRNLASYVKNGGKLVLFSDSSKIDKSRQQEWLLLKLLSNGKAVPGEIYNSETVTMNCMANSLFDSSFTMDITRLRDIDNWDFAKTLASYNNKAVIKTWKYGDGDVVYVAGVPFLGTEADECQDFMNQLYNWAGVKTKVSSRAVNENGKDISVYKAVKEIGNDKYVFLFPNEWETKTSRVNLSFDWLDTEEKLYNAYLMKPDYDLFLQEYGGGYLDNSITLNSNEATIIKYTTDTIHNNVNGFGTDSAWTYYEGGVKLGYDKASNSFKNGGNSVVYPTTVKVSGKEVARKWTAPSDSVISLEGYAKMMQDGTKGVATIKHNGNTVWTQNLDGLVRHHIHEALSVKKGDTIEFCVTGNGTAQWIPYISESRDFEKIAFDQNGVYTVAEDGKILCSATAKSSEDVVLKILKNGSKVYIDEVTPMFNEPNKIYFEINAKAGDKLTYIVEGNKSAVTFNGNMWLVK